MDTTETSSRDLAEEVELYAKHQEALTSSRHRATGLGSADTNGGIVSQDNHNIDANELKNPSAGNAAPSGTGTHATHTRDPFPGDRVGEGAMAQQVCVVLSTAERELLAAIAGDRNRPRKPWPS